MPVPLRDDGRSGATKRLIVFVHGFMSSSATWDPLKRLLEHDPSVMAEFDLRLFDYETAAGAVPVIRRLPTLEEAGKSLAAELAGMLFDARGGEQYIDVTLVGHSMGGLIIQSCILELLKPAGAARVLQRIRQVILFATPNFGSTTLGRLRSLVSRVAENPQERALRLFSEQGMRIHEAIRERVIHARRRARDEYPIPFYCFWGREDAVVRAESALGYFQEGAPLAGDHFTVHCPGSAGLPGYHQFVSVLRCPCGHTNIWEIERFTMTVKVSPLPPGSAVTASHGGKTRLVTCDNVATVVRKATFSVNNRCREPYVLKYGTRNGGWVVPRISEPHVTSADKLRLYDDNGFDAYYEVEPAPGRSAWLELTVYKGFDGGHRDFHTHLGLKSCYRRVNFDLDLTDYVRSGWRVTKPPQLFFHLTDPGDHALCGERNMIHPDPPTEVDGRGIWRWELEFVQEGVVDIAWDVDAPVVRPMQHTDIMLNAGEHAIFGYGSLLSIASLERTLGRTYTGPFVACAIAGWRRRWNVAMPNDQYMFRRLDRWVTPQRIVYLNVEPVATDVLNGILFVVGEDELARFDAREWIYDRVDINHQLQGVRVGGGSAWVYRAKPEYVIPPQDNVEIAAIRRTYLDILATGHRELGADFVAAYRASTDEPAPSLVIDDVRRDDISVV